MPDPLALRKILVVDDEPANLQLMRHILQNQYQLMFAKDGQRAIELAREQQPDLILMDVMMPGMSGLDACRVLKADALTARIPVIFVTALGDVDDEINGFNAGGVDYIAKPVRPLIVRARVAAHLSLVRAEELEETRLQIIQRLGRAAEYKDNETGLHVIRMSHYSRLLGLAAGLDEARAQLLLNAAPMHDIGKIGIPDAILLKPGKLDDAEWQVMRKHPMIGARIIGDHASPLLALARDIAFTHHEKWDGSGYPRRLQGEEIPLEGRIVAIADVFDALTTERPYKKAWTVEQAIELLQNDAASHFDPALVPLFVDQLPQVLEVKAQWGETSAPET